jgi:hypothetical protein
MVSFDSSLLDKIRTMARKGDRPSVILREIITQLSPANADQFVLIRYFAEAFSFKDGQGHPVHGWFPDGSGELKDADIDRIMSKRIQQNRPQWDNPDATSRQAS